MIEVYLILELTNRCNLDCLYCYNVWKETGDFTNRDLSPGGVEVILENISGSARIGGITLAGGEPLLNPAVFEIMALIKARNIPQSMTTNGLLLDESAVIRLKEAGLGQVEVSMPAALEATFDSLCGSKELKKVRNAVLMARKHGIRTSVSSVITLENITEVRNLIEMAAGLGADHFLFNRFIPGGKGKRYTRALRPDHRMLTEALQEAQRASSDFNIPVTVPIPFESCVFDTAGLPGLSFGTCSCGRLKWLADPNGNLRTCEQNPHILGSLLEHSFETLIRKNEARNFRNLNFRTHCEEKPCFAKCGGGCRFAETTSSS